MKKSNDQKDRFQNIRLLFPLEKAKKCLLNFSNVFEIFKEVVYNRLVFHSQNYQNFTNLFEVMLNSFNLLNARRFFAKTGIFQFKVWEETSLMCIWKCWKTLRTKIADVCRIDPIRRSFRKSGKICANIFKNVMDTKLYTFC